MQYLGDYAEDEPIYFIWNTTDSAGGSVTRTVDGTISVYKDASNGTGFDLTQVTTGVTNVEDCDGLTGVHSCCIVTTNAWYETGHSYAVMLSGSTVDGQIVNSVIAQFSIESRSAALAVNPVEVIESIFDYDMGDWTEVDVAADRVTIDYTNERIAITDLDDDEDVYVYKATDTSVQDFILDCEFQVLSTGIEGSKIGIGLADSVGTMEDVDNGLYLRASSIGSTFVTYIYHMTAGTPQVSGSISGMLLDTKYYGRLIRRGSYCWLGIYSDRIKETHVTGSPVEYKDTTSVAFTHLYPMVGYDDGSAGMAMDAYVESIKLISAPDIDKYLGTAKAGTNTVLAGIDTNVDTLVTGVNMTQISGDTTAANNLESYCDGTTKIPANIMEIGSNAQSMWDIKDFADTGYNPITNKILGCVANDDMVGTDNAATATALATVDGNVDDIKTNLLGRSNGLRALEEMLISTNKIEVIENCFDIDMGYWTEVDVPGRVTIDYSNERIAIADLDDDEDVYVYKAMDANVTDFILDFEFQVLSTTTGANAVFGIGLADGIGTMEDVNNGLYIRIYWGGADTTSVQLAHMTGGLKLGAAAIPSLLDNATYYGRLIRRGSYCWLAIFSDRIRETHVTGSPVEYKDVTPIAFTHLYPMAAYDSGSTGKAMDAYVEGIKLISTSSIISDKIDTVDGNVDTILVDTNDLQTSQGAWATATTTALSAQGKLDVNAEVVDVIRTDTSSEPAQGAPTVTPTMEEMIAYLYFKMRNKGETTASEDTMYDDAGTTKIMKAAISDNGTTFVKAKYVSGP